MLSIGKQLARARQERGLTVEDAAFHTRIPAPRLRDLENDDLSRFANLTYAKGFLKIYSRYLDLDISEYIDQFSTADFAQAASHEYLQTANATHNLPSSVITDYGRGRQPGIYVLLLLIVGLVGFFIFRSGDEDPENTAPAAAPPAAPAAPAEPPASPAPVQPPPVETQPLPPPPADPAVPTEPPPSSGPRPTPPGQPVPKAEPVPEDEEESGAPIPGLPDPPTAPAPATAPALGL